MSLEQIAQLLDGNVSLEEVRGMLRLRQSQLRRQAKAVASELARVEARLRQIEMEETMPDLEVVLKMTEPMIVASRRVLIPKPYRPLKRPHKQKSLANFLSVLHR